MRVALQLFTAVRTKSTMDSMLTSGFCQTNYHNLMISYEANCFHFLFTFRTIPRESWNHHI